MSELQRRRARPIAEEENGEFRPFQQHLVQPPPPNYPTLIYYFSSVDRVEGTAAKLKTIFHAPTGYNQLAIQDFNLDFGGATITTAPKWDYIDLRSSMSPYNIAVVSADGTHPVRTTNDVLLRLFPHSISEATTRVKDPSNADTGEYIPTPIRYRIHNGLNPPFYSVDRGLFNQHALHYFTVTDAEGTTISNIGEWQLTLIFRKVD